METPNIKNINSSDLFNVLNKDDKKYFRILSIDGGGVRGIIPSIVLEYIEKRTGKKINQLFDLISGTSTGALLGGILTIPNEKGTAKYTAKEVTKLYFEECPKIFKKGFFKNLKSMHGLMSASYSRKNKRDVIESYTNDFKISDCLVDIVIPAFDVKEGTPYFFKSSSARKDERCNYKMVDVLDATSSAPTYFSPCKVEGYDSKYDYRSFVDGALVANSPALCALSEAIKNYGIAKENILLISIGTGSQKIQKEHNVVKKWGALNWASYFPNSLISASMDVCHYEIDHLLSSDISYFRIQSNITDSNHAKIDDVSINNMTWLKSQAEELIDQEKDRLDKICDLLMGF